MTGHNSINPRPRPSNPQQASPQPKVAVLAIQADVAATVEKVERDTVNLFAEYSKDDMTAAELAAFKLQLDGMTSGMEMFTAAKKAYHDTTMSIIRNLA